MRIGLTFFLRKEVERSIWSSGATQNTVFLWMLLKSIPGVEVVAINAGYPNVAPQAGLMLGELGVEFAAVTDDLFDTLDVLIEAEGQVSAAHIARVRDRGGKAVAYKFGNAFVIDAERIIHGKPSGSIFNGSRFDEVWTNQQHAHTCASYWETTYRCPVRIMPHIWHHYFVEKAAAEIAAKGGHFGYVPGASKKRVGIFEPNINIVKTCVIPVLACEALYRRRPQAIRDVYVLNTERLKGHVTFEHFATNLDLWRDSKISFEARFNTPWFLSRHADVMLSHQWENGLNYAYYDALYGGYPLVHNSEMLSDGIGYRYDGFDVDGAAAALEAALTTHDERYHDQLDAGASLLASVGATEQHNIDEHARVLTEAT